jgi:hypothetical protein
MSRAWWCVLLIGLAVIGCDNGSPTKPPGRQLEVRCPARAKWECNNVQYQGEMMLAVHEKCIGFRNLSGASMRARITPERLGAVVSMGPSGRDEVSGSQQRMYMETIRGRRASSAEFGRGPGIGPRSC